MKITCSAPSSRHLSTRLSFLLSAVEAVGSLGAPQQDLGILGVGGDQRRDEGVYAVLPRLLGGAGVLEFFANSQQCYRFIDAARPGLGDVRQLCAVDAYAALGIEHLSRVLPVFGFVQAIELPAALQAGMEPVVSCFVQTGILGQRLEIGQLRSEHLERAHQLAQLVHGGTGKLITVVRHLSQLLQGEEAFWWLWHGFAGESVVLGFCHRFRSEIAGVQARDSRYLTAEG